MNIFVLDKNPEIAATMHCDVHCNSQLRESVQILSTVTIKQGFEARYEATHRNHPCVIWAGASSTNYSWLVKLALALRKEWHYRYGRWHGSGEDPLQAVLPIPDLPDVGLTEFAQAMPEQYRQPGNAVAAYRAYYLGEKRGARLGKWNKSRQAPEWWT